MEPVQQTFDDFEASNHQTAVSCTNRAPSSTNIYVPRRARCSQILFRSRLIWVSNASADVGRAVVSDIWPCTRTS